MKVDGYGSSVKKKFVFPKPVEVALKRLTRLYIANQARYLSGI